MQTNRFECLVLRTLYQRGIFWRGEEGVQTAIRTLREQGRLPADARIDVVKVLTFANCTESSPPTRHHGGKRDVYEELQSQGKIDKLKEVLAKMKGKL